MPPRPSTRKTGAAFPERVRRKLRGDLDNIVLKALRKEPDARYPSVAALIEDIERHLDGRRSKRVSRRSAIALDVSRAVTRSASRRPCSSPSSLLAGLAAQRGRRESPAWSATTPAARRRRPAASASS
jgi:serine/threonine-protein kinase